MAIEIVSVAPGTRFRLNGDEYTLTKVLDDGGLNWMGEDGKYKLSQHFYPVDGMPTPEYLESMKKYLRKLSS